VTVTPSISFGNVTTTKATGAASFVATLNAPSNLPVTVNYITQDGSAMAVRDYVSSSGTVTFAPGQTSRTITVPLVGGSNWEPDRTFQLSDSSPANATLSAASATAIIQSQDGMPAAGLIPDELDPNQSDLVVYAPAGNNAIQVKTTKIAGQVQVMINRATVATDSGIDRVIVFGGSGNNNLTVSPRIGAGVIFFGGQGRTVATGGGGNDILVGGSGPNLLAGG
jgi:hypothetical protein